MHDYVALYCRLSPRPDGSYEGVEDQERWGRKYAAQTWPGGPVEVFPDRGISAANGDVRPELDRLRAWLADGRIAHVWAVEQSRISRETDGRYPWFTLAAEMDAAGVPEVHTNRDGIVRVRDEVAGIKAVLAAAEVRKMKRRVNDKLDERAAAGVPPGVRPFGYRAVGSRETRTYEIVPEQADAIRWAAGKVLDGWSLAGIAAVLDGQGVRGVHGGRITPQAVRGWLTAPSIAGLRVHRGEVTGKGNWPPILDEQTWRQVCAVLAEPRIVRRRDGRTYPVTEAHRGPVGRRYLLTGGLARCAVCSAPLAGADKQLRNASGVRTKPYLMCHPNRGGKGCVGIMLPEVEAHVVASLFAKLEAEPGFAAALSADQHAARRAELAGALAAVEAERVEYARDAAAGTMTRAEWLAMRQVFAGREAGLRRELAQIPQPTGRVNWQEMRDSWGDDAELAEQRAFLRRYIATVVIVRARPGTKGFDPGRVKIKWAEV